MLPQHQNPGGKPSKDANWRSSDRECRSALASMMRLTLKEFDEKYPKNPSKQLAAKMTVAQWATARYIRENVAEALARFLPNVWADDVVESIPLSKEEIHLLQSHSKPNGLTNGHATA